MTPPLPDDAPECWSDLTAAQQAQWLTPEQRASRDRYLALLRKRDRREGHEPVQPAEASDAWLAVGGCLAVAVGLIAYLIGALL